jgi:hypothetical protein
MSKTLSLAVCRAPWAPNASNRAVIGLCRSIVRLRNPRSGFRHFFQSISRRWNRWGRQMYARPPSSIEENWKGMKARESLGM